MTELADLMVASLGEPRYDSPLSGYIGGRETNEHYVDEDDRVILHDTVALLGALPGGLGGRSELRAGRAASADLLSTGRHPGGHRHLRWAVSRAERRDPRSGDGTGQALRHHRDHRLPARLRGSGPGQRACSPLRLTPQVVHDINEQGGTILGSSRGAQDPYAMVDELVGRKINILFVIGGDGSMRGAAGIAAALRERSIPIGVIGIPKTIDNDIPFIGQSFGFVTAFGAAAKSINSAMIEARSAIGGVGLVKLMGRHSGFIACYAALASHEADFVLIPEVPFGLDGPAGFLEALHQRVKDRGSAVVVVAEGAGQTMINTGGDRRLREHPAGRHRAVPEDQDHRALRRPGQPVDLEVLRSRLLDQVGTRRSPRFGLLRPAGPGGRPRRHGGPHRHGGGASAQPLHSRADRPRGLRSAIRWHRTATCG